MAKKESGTTLTNIKRKAQVGYTYIKLINLIKLDSQNGYKKIV